MSYTNIINSFLNVRNKVKDMEGNWVDVRRSRETIHVVNTTQETLNTQQLVFERWGNKIVIDSLEYSVNNINIYPRLHTQLGSSGRTTNNIFMGIRTDTGSVWDSTINYIQYGSDFLEVSDSESSGHKVVLKRPIILPSGGKLTFHSSSNSVDHVVTYKVVYRVIED